MKFNADIDPRQFLIQDEYVFTTGNDKDIGHQRLTQPQRRELPASESAITSRTLCADAAVSNAESNSRESEEHGERINFNRSAS
jgi:hypothetical protein